MATLPENMLATAELLATVTGLRLAAPGYGVRCRPLITRCFHD